VAGTATTFFLGASQIDAGAIVTGFNFGIIQR